MSRLNFSYENVLQFISEKDIKNFSPVVTDLHHALHRKNGLGNEYLGWIDHEHDRAEIERIKQVAERINADSDILVVVGVGGSYLGARAAIEMLTHNFSDLQSFTARKRPHIVFVGHNMSATYINELLSILEDKEVSVNVVSKSGTTTEPAIAFRVFRKFLQKKYGKAGAAKRIYVTTDREHGALKTIADQEGYETFVIPDDIGGRYSVLTPVGFLPMAVSGIDIDSVILGMKQAMADLKMDELAKNPAYQYAVARHLLYKQGFTIEVLANYEPKLSYFADWWVQLFGESEGKEGQGIFPTVVNFPTDLHSLGQYIQDGRRIIFETVLRVQTEPETLVIEHDEDNLDGLNYLAGKTLNEINLTASDAAMLAHVEGGVPNLVIDVKQLDALTFGYLVYFFAKACAMSGYLLGVNPFDQPGVEAYKERMFELLGKPGYERLEQSEN